MSASIYAESVFKSTNFELFRMLVLMRRIKLAASLSPPAEMITSKGSLRRSISAPKSEEKRGGSQQDGVAQYVVSYQEREKLIELELEFARVKLDTLSLEMQLQAGRPKERPKIRLNDVERIVKVFGGTRGENVKKWLNLLASTVTSYSGAEDDFYRIARALLVGVARECASKALWTDWKSLRAGVYDELRRRVRRASETSEEYVLAMEVIANDEVAEIDSAGDRGPGWKCAVCRHVGGRYDDSRTTASLRSNFETNCGDSIYCCAEFCRSLCCANSSRFCYN